MTTSTALVALPVREPNPEGLKMALQPRKRIDPGYAVRNERATAADLRSSSTTDPWEQNGQSGADNHHEYAGEFYIVVHLHTIHHSSQCRIQVVK